MNPYDTATANRRKGDTVEYSRTYVLRYKRLTREGATFLAATTDAEAIKETASFAENCGSTLAYARVTLSDNRVYEARFAHGCIVGEFI